jgi:SAM-dependent methyltransferase
MEGRPGWSVLFLDDASSDDTTQVARRLFASHGHPDWQVARNAQNQGYGGNQKVGYRYALDRGGFTHVALLHGDCQYPPEALPDLLDKAVETGADVAYATRMWSVASARRGGMPLYKILGNRALSLVQNRLTGRSLSEYHSGMRLYSADLLSRIPFELNSDGFDFDTEILLQAFYVGARVEEIPIPTRYAGEVCRVPGLAYAANITRATFDYWLQTHGMGCSLRFRDLRGDQSQLVDKTGIPGTVHNFVVQNLLKRGVSSVLDLGCGPGYVGRLLKQSVPAIRYAGVDQSPTAPAACDEYYRADLDAGPPPVDPFKYDAVLCLDLLEHLSEPEEFLLRLRQTHQSAPNTVFLMSAVNVAFITLRLGMLFLGRFEYGDRGILHIAHRRLMTRDSFVRLLQETGYVVEKVEAMPVPFALVFGDNARARAFTSLAAFLARVMPRMFSFQTLVIARARRGVPGIGSEGGESAALSTQDIGTEDEI